MALSNMKDIIHNETWPKDGYLNKRFTKVRISITKEYTYSISNSLLAFKK